MSNRQRKKLGNVRIGKKLKFRIADLESIAAEHDADRQRGVEPHRPSLGKLNDLVGRFPSSAAMPPHVAVPVSKRDYGRLVRLAKDSGLAVESLLSLWVRQQLARLDTERARVRPR